MLVYGRFIDASGVKHHVPARCIDSEDPEAAIIKTAWSIARSKNVRAVRIWGVYETERQLA